MLVTGFGGPGAIATTVFFGAGGGGGPDEVGVLPAVELGAVFEPAAELGESASAAEFLLVAAAKMGALTTEFFRLAAFFVDRIGVPVGPAVGCAPLPRLRFLITSVFKLSGRTTPCSLRNKPQALQSG